MSVLRCGQCAFENDLSRKFCQNCGTRLEVNPTQEAAPAAATPVRKSRGSKAPKRASHGALRILLGMLIRTAILAALIAAAIQAARTPDAIPPALPARPQLASLLAADIQAAKESAYPRTVEITSEAANNFLANRIQGFREAGGGLRATFERAYVIPKNGTVVLGVEQRLRNYPIYLQLFAEPISEENLTQVRLIGGSIGRLAIPGKLAPLFARSFSGVLDNLEAPLGWFSSATSVQIAETGATVSWPGRAAQ